MDFQQQQKNSLEKKVNSFEKLKVTKENSPNNKSKTYGKYEKFKAAVEVNRKSPVNKKVTVKENNGISNMKILTSPQDLSNDLRSFSPTVKDKRDVMMTTNKVVNDERRDIYNTPTSDKRLRDRSKITNSNSVERSKSIIPTVSPSNPMIDIESDKLLVSRVEKYNQMLHELLTVDGAFVNSVNKNNGTSSPLLSNKKPETDEILARVDKYNQRLNNLLANITKSPSDR